VCSNSFHSCEKEYPSPRGARVAHQTQRRSTTRLPKQFASAVCTAALEWKRHTTCLLVVPRLTRRSQQEREHDGPPTFRPRRILPPPGGPDSNRVRVVRRPEPARGCAGGRPARCARNVSRHLSVVQVEPEVRLATDPEPGASALHSAPSCRRIALGSRACATHASDFWPPTSLPAS
jgi:hypothetical protein